jgi:hypothetical protein
MKNTGPVFFAAFMQHATPEISDHLIGFLGNIIPYRKKNVDLI